MQRTALVLLAVTLLLLTPSPAHAGPSPSHGTQDAFDTVASVIGTLGLYAAMMAILAVGAEILIDVAKPILGLKRNRTTAEALEELRNWLPSSVEDLGLAPDARERLNQSISELEEVTHQFTGQVERAQAVVQERLPDILKDLVVKSAEEVIEVHWPKIEAQLKEIESPALADDPLDRLEGLLEEHQPDLVPQLRNLRGEVNTEAVRAWLSKTLNRLKGTSVAEIEARVESFNKSLQAIEKQRYKLQGPARRLWRWLRDSRWSREWLGWFLIRVEYAWAWLRDKLPDEGFSEQLEYLRNPYETEQVKTLQEAAERFLAVNGQHQLRENRRITWLRVISGVVGVALAATLRVDSLQLLEPLLGEAADAFRTQGTPVQWYSFADLIQQNTARTFDPTLALPGILGATATTLLRLTPGIILSGLGAAAGSGFWHDQLARLRSFKETARQVEQLTEQAGN